MAATDTPRDVALARLSAYRARPAWQRERETARAGLMLALTSAPEGERPGLAVALALLPGLPRIGP